MLAGGLPFAGDTAEDVRAAILKDKLPPLSADIPDRLKWIVKKSLRKDPDERYQTVREMFSDLRELRQEEIESEVIRERSLPPTTSGGLTRSLSSGQASFGTMQSEAATAQIASPSTSSTEYIVTQIKRHKTGAIAALALATVGCFGIAYAVYRLALRPKPTFAHFQNMKITKLTTK
jgi:serine/threonine protein kinase